MIVPSPRPETPKIEQNMQYRPLHEIDYKIILDYMLEHGAYCYLHKIEDKSSRNMAYEAALRLVGAYDKRNYKRIECSYDLVDCPKHD